MTQILAAAGETPDTQKVIAADPVLGLLRVEKESRYKMLYVEAFLKHCVKLPQRASIFSAK